MVHHTINRRSYHSEAPGWCDRDTCNEIYEYILMGKFRPVYVWN